MKKVIAAPSYFEWAWADAQRRKAARHAELIHVINHWAQQMALNPVFKS